MFDPASPFLPANGPNLLVPARPRYPRLTSRVGFAAQRAKPLYGYGSIPPHPYPAGSCPGPLHAPPAPLAAPAPFRSPQPSAPATARDSRLRIAADIREPVRLPPRISPPAARLPAGEYHRGPREK